MEWKDVAQAVAKAAPILGTLLGGPAGAAVGGLLAAELGTSNTPDAINAALLNTPDALIKIKQIEADNRVQLQQLVVTAEANRLSADTASVQAVNATMQAEARADHWPTYTWRPFIGFVFGCYLGSLFVLPIFGKAPVMLSSELTMAVGAILGIASFYRGKMQADPNVKTDNRG